MYRVLPAPRIILEDPFLDGVALNCKADIVWISTVAYQLAVDLPLAVPSLEPKCSGNSRRVRGIGEAIELSDKRGVNTVIRNDWPINNDFQNLLTLTSRQNITGRATTVVLLQTILQIKSLACQAGEIDDHVDTFSDGKATAGDLHWLFHQISVRAYLPKRLARIVGRIEHKHLIETRWPGIQPAESVPSRTYVQHWLYLAVDEKFIT